MPKLSIIMPIYNTGKFLKRSIGSVLQQTFRDYELILVNDGSTDNSRNICMEYVNRDSRVILIDKENGGAGSARNSGLQVAKGEYVVFPDSDDWIESNAYEFCIDEMQKQNLDLLLFGSINTIYDEQGNIVAERTGNTSDILLYNKNECRNHWAKMVTTLPMDGPSNKIYRMNIIKENNLYFPDIRRMQDGVFNMHYFDKINSFKSTNKCFYHFTMHAQEYQIKKIPNDFLKCAITYHRTAIEMMTKWNVCNVENEILLGKWFSETICTAEFEYLPDSSTNMAGVLYKHICNINCDSYVHNFMKRHSKLCKLSKRETAIKNQWNLLLYILALYQTHKK